MVQLGAENTLRRAVALADEQDVFAPRLQTNHLAHFLYVAAVL